MHRFSGEVLTQEANFGKNMRARFGAPFMDIRRIDLQRALFEKAQKLGVSVVLGEKVEVVDRERAEIITVSGRRATADLIVAADGVRSQCRISHAQGPDLPYPTGDMVYRAVLNLDGVTDDALREWISTPAVHIWLGPESHAVGYSMQSGYGYNLAFVAPDDLPAGVAKQTCPVDEAKQLLKNWDPALIRLLDTAESMEKWKLMRRDMLPTWVNDKSTLVFVGDACHPMLPYLAQGANSALEDGAVLGRLLGHVKERNQLPHAIKRYEKLRKSRMEKIVGEAAKQAQHRKELKGPSPFRLVCPEAQQWLFGYDAYQEVEASMNGKPFENGMATSN
ncbi:hypothetical protein RJ55_04054 [Drechmeria coniospora]|nr:hypothetical protein RJ55_04054 [Drechmeria coniospora]